MDLRTTYMGIELAHPIVASASPLSQTLDGVRQLEDGGAAAIVLFSLFEEQIRQENAALERLLVQGAEHHSEALSYFPDVGNYRAGPEEYLQLIHQASEACDVPIIASLNGVSDSGWTSYAKQMQQAGARAIELNIFYIPADVTTSGRAVEERYVRIVREVHEAVDIPVAVKLNPFFSATGEMAKRLAEAGADGLVLFNRFYQPDFDLERLEVVPNLELSSPNEIRLPLLWIALLYGRVQASLAATSGVSSHLEIVKYLLAGADVAMTTSALLRRGVDYLGSLKRDLATWLDKRGYTSVTQMKGSMSQQNVADPAAFERANYIKVLGSYRV